MHPDKFHSLIAKTSPSPMGLEVDRAEGIYIYDTSGKKFIDFISGIGVSSLGHGHPEVIDAITQQSNMYMHTMVYGEHVQSPQIALAKQITSLLPASLNCCYFLNSGTEANEAALKLAKRLTGRPKVMSLHGAYHGSTHGSLSVSGGEHRKAAFRPLLPGIDFISINDMESLKSITEEHACVIAETIQGDAGVRIPDPEWITALRKRCDETGTLLILDEIQCGLGRTGKHFAFEHFGIEPDILTLGKSLGAGLPIGALISSKSNLDAFTHDPMLGHITTFGGNPVICAAANKGLEVYLRESLVDDVESKGELFESKLEGCPNVLETRRMGLFIAIDLDSEDKVQQCVEGCFERGLLVYWFLSCPKSFRIAPPLSSTRDEIEQATQILVEVLTGID
jgi:acetylornithine/succinyldiaminopimelate/putrescine aminotransferase